MIRSIRSAAPCCRLFVITVLAALSLAPSARAQSGIGACCSVNPLNGQAVCTANSSPSACAQAGGTFLDGSACASCTLQGACCLSDGTCTTTLSGASATPTTCHPGVGTFFGGSCTPNPCPAPTTTGVCCNASTGACSVTTRTICSDGNNIFMPGLSSCAAPAQPCPLIGACCRSNDCISTTQAGCNGFLWQANTACPAAGGTCPAQGACCNVVTGSCIQTVAASCPASTSQFFTGAACASAPCIPPQGSCCLPSGVCIVTVRSECLSLGGTFIPSAAGGAGACVTNNCPQQTGACCIVGAAFGCVNITAAQCPSTAIFNPGIACNSNPCPNTQGACCTPNGCIVIAAAACSAAGYNFFPATACSSTACPPLGACCTAAAGCTTTTFANCVGHWLNSVPCTPAANNPCTPASGACCTAFAACQITAATACNGQWYASNACAPDPCPRGGCCNPANGLCAIVTQIACHNHGLLWLGAGVPCTPSSCPNVTGACCHAGSPACTLSTQSQCTGKWLASSTCKPNPCCPPNYSGSGTSPIVADIFAFLRDWFSGCP